MVAAVPTWPELLTHPEFPVDVVLLDLDLKDNIPVSLKITTLKTTGVKVVLMSTYSEPNVVREALAAGALGYLVKSEDAGMIVEAIRAAANGESFVSAELDLALNAGEIGGAPKLSAQERRVMALYGGGEPVKAVAFQLSHLRGDGQELPQAHPREVPRRRLRRGHEGRAAQAGDRGRHPHRVGRPARPLNRLERHARSPPGIRPGGDLRPPTRARARVARPCRRAPPSAPAGCRP